MTITSTTMDGVPISKLRLFTQFGAEKVYENYNQGRIGLSNVITLVDAFDAWKT
jgi:hypothetical protein